MDLVATSKRLLATIRGERIERDGLTIEVTSSVEVTKRAADLVEHSLLRFGRIVDFYGADDSGLQVCVGEAHDAEAVHAALVVKGADDPADLVLALGFDTAQEARVAVDVAAGGNIASFGSVELDTIKALLTDDRATHKDACVTIMKAVGLGSSTIDAATIVKRDCTIAKADEDVELRLVLGIVLQPEVTDSQGDIYSADEIRKTAHGYMEHFQNISIQHRVYRNDVIKLVESYIAENDQTIGGTVVKAGTWLVKVRIDDDDTWKEIQEGKLTGFSIAGVATKTPVREPQAEAA